MPYPILSLPYLFNKRLRQLLSPLEALKLQTAGGPLQIQWKPPVKVVDKIEALFHPDKLTSKVVLRCDVNKEVVFLPSDDENEIVLLSSNTVKFCSLTESCFMDPGWKNISVLTNAIKVCHGYGTVKSLEVLASIAPTALNVDLSQAAYSKEVTLSFMLNLFPEAFMLKTTNIYHGWATELAMNQFNIGLKHLSLCSYDNTYDLLFGIQPQELRTFMENHKSLQCIHFCCTLLRTTNINHLIFHVLSIFDDHFKRGLEGKHKIRIDFHTNENYSMYFDF